MISTERCRWSRSHRKISLNRFKKKKENQTNKRLNVERKQIKNANLLTNNDEHENNFHDLSLIIIIKHYHNQMTQEIKA